MKCVITKAAEPVDVAHIYPFSMRNIRQPLSLPSFSFWSVLKLFWSPERVKKWYDAIFSTDAGTEIVSNLMCLCPNAHRYHERAFFALKPVDISEDKKKLRMQFYWLPKNKFSNGVDALRVPVIPETEDGSIHEIGLWDVKTRQEIHSGHVLDVETDDPENLPLPDVRLLDMQWMLNRVAALSGAAEPRDDSFHDDDTDDDGWDDVAPGYEDLFDTICIRDEQGQLPMTTCIM